MSQERRLEEGTTEQPRPKSRHGIMSKGLHYLKKIIDRQGPLGDWAFVILCMAAIDNDSTFLLIPEIDDDKMCVQLNEDLRIRTIVCRSVADFLYIIYTLFPVRTRLLYKSEREMESLWWLFFIVDLIAIIPVPQVLVSYHPKSFMFSVHFLLIQLVIRIIRMFPSLRKVKIRSIREEAMFANVIFIFAFIEGSSVFGSLWYFLAIKRETACWMKSFTDRKEKWSHSSFYCSEFLGNYNKFLNDSCFMNKQNTLYDFGIYGDALQSVIVKVNASDIWQKNFYSLRWGLQSISGFGQGLQPTADNAENIFVLLITLFGVWLLVILIGIFQKQMILQNYITRSVEGSSRMREIKQWKPFSRLSKDLRCRIDKFHPTKIQETTGLDVENFLNYLSEGPGKEVKLELCLPLLKKVKEFGVLREPLLEELCNLVKPISYKSRTHIVRMGEPVNEMIFVVQGELWPYTTNGETTGGPDFLTDGDFCGEELLNWLQNFPTSFNLPTSNRAIIALTHVEAFALMADDVRNVFAKQMSPEE